MAGMPERSDVIVIGAGFSGLYAAWLLSREGATVTVLEARRRVGAIKHPLLDGVVGAGAHQQGLACGRGRDGQGGAELAEEQGSCWGRQAPHAPPLPGPSSPAAGRRPAARRLSQ